MVYSFSLFESRERFLVSCLSPQLGVRGHDAGWCRGVVRLHEAGPGCVCRPVAETLLGCFGRWATRSRGGRPSSPRARLAGGGGGAGSRDWPPWAGPGPGPSAVALGRPPPRARTLSHALSHSRARSHSHTLAHTALLSAPGKAGPPAAPWAPACGTRASWSTQVRRRGRAAAPPRGPAHPSRLTLSSFLSPLPAPAAGVPPSSIRPAEEKQVGELPRHAWLGMAGCSPGPARSELSGVDAAVGWCPAAWTRRRFSPGLGVLALFQLDSSGKSAFCLLHLAGSWVGFLFFSVPLGVSSRFGRRKAAQGLAIGVSVLGARLPITLPSLCSTDAQAQTQPRHSPLLVGVADHHLTGRRDLGVREHLFCFAKQIAILRRAFESWRESRVMQSDNIDRFFLVHYLVFGGV